MVQQVPPIPQNIDENKASPQPATAAGNGELERVRDIILGPDRTRTRMQGAEVDRLRQVIFGAQMEEYERRFADVRRETERILTDLRVVQDSVSEFQKNQTKRVEALEREMRRTNDELRREIDRLGGREAVLQQILTRTQQQELNSKSVAENIHELSTTQSQHESEVRALKTAIGENRDQQERKLDTLKREVRQAEDDLRAELRRVTDRLGDQKTDRKALAAMLMEVATRLETGSSVTGLLEGLTAAVKE
jgi:chromosome segregation ATPase